MTLPTLESRSILVTGGGSGIGAGTARFLVEQGARVTVSGRRAEPLRELVRELGPLARAVQGDVTDADDRQRMIDVATDHGEGLFGLVNNAGNMYRGELESLTEAGLIEIFQSNVIGAMLLTGLATEALAAAQGSVVFLGSVHVKRAFPGVSPYAATKGAIEALTRSLAAELGERAVRVNCVVPGAVYSEINQRAGLLDDAQAKARLEGLASSHALGRIGRAEEVAQAIGHLLVAPWTTGTVLDVDGGLGLGLTRA